MLNDKQQQVCVAEHSQHKHKAFAEKCGKHLIQKTGGLKFNYVCWFVGCSGNSQAQEAVNSRRVKEFRMSLSDLTNERRVSLCKDCNRQKHENSRNVTSGCDESKGVRITVFCCERCWATERIPLTDQTQVWGCGVGGC